MALISKIEVLTKMRTIDVGDYESFELIGYDKKGNAFTSLEGLRFEWSAQQEKQIAKFVTFKDSSILSSKLRHHMEEKRYQTDIRVMQGLQTGWVTVTANVNEQGYEVRKKELLMIKSRFNPKTSFD